MIQDYRPEDHKVGFEAFIASIAIYLVVLGLLTAFSSIGFGWDRQVDVQMAGNSVSTRRHVTLPSTK